MDFSTMGTLAEVVSAVGVIVSLIYVAAQVRHNTRAVRSATTMPWSRHGSTMWLWSTTSTGRAPWS